MKGVRTGGRLKFGLKDTGSTGYESEVVCWSRVVEYSFSGVGLPRYCWVVKSLNLELRLHAAGMHRFHSTCIFSLLCAVAVRAD